MTPQEAIEKLNAFGLYVYDEGIGNAYIPDGFHSALEMAIEALQKQIPSFTVPMIEDEFGHQVVYHHCPKCNTWIMEKENYCNKCGSKMMWRDEE